MVAITAQAMSESVDAKEIENWLENITAQPHLAGTAEGLEV
jgi:hypothetical protein